MNEHIHCEVCKTVIEKPNKNNVITYCFDKNVIYYELGVCERCVIKAGLRKYDKPENKIRRLKK